MTQRESLWSALLRSKVVRSVALYLASAWLLIQVASLIAGIWSLPAGFVQDLFVLLVLGLPVVSVFSWIYVLGDDVLVETRASGFCGGHDSSAYGVVLALPVHPIA